MEIRPILSTLFRNRIGATLIALQIALTMAVVINSVFIILDRAETMRKPLGVDVEHLIRAGVATPDRDDDVRAMVDDNRAALLAIDGVQQVTSIATLPLSNSGSTSSFRVSDEEDAAHVNVSFYWGDEHMLETLGLELTRGRWFTPEEIVYDPPEGSQPKFVVLSDESAKEMYGDEDPVGKFMYTHTGEAIEVIGTVRMLARPWYSWGNFYATALFPVVQRNDWLVMRVAPEDRDRLLPVIEQALVDVDPERLVSAVGTHSDVVAHTYQRDVAMNRMLTVVMALVLIITALGIVGLASFSVSQRRRQIGTRRAIGARRYHILRYFLVENWLITTGGIVLGLVLSFTINHLLVTEYNLPKLDPVYLPLVVLGLWGVGLLAAFGPARNAMTVDPAIATRNV